MLHLLLHRGLRRVLVFTASLEATHRLFLLLQLFMQRAGHRVSVGEFSSTLSQGNRAAMIRKVRATEPGVACRWPITLGPAMQFEVGELDVLVTSDATARGLDLQRVAHVINYDSPVFVKTYVHRVGRTARAGASGAAYTICKEDEARHFKSIRRRISEARPAKTTLQASDYEDLAASFAAVLAELQSVVGLEATVAHTVGRAKDEAVAALRAKLDGKRASSRKDDRPASKKPRRYE